MRAIETVRQIIIRFCTEFIEHPYLCYTEHGQHALFYARLYDALPSECRYTAWQGRKFCVVQKEYPTAGKLDKSKRQHWDIAVIKSPAESSRTEAAAYDYLKLAAAVEFGMNAQKKHLEEDIRRLTHQRADLAQGFVVHAYRLSKPGMLFSKRDWSPNSALILSPDEVARMSRKKSVEIFYAMADATGRYPSEVWHIMQGEKKLLPPILK